MLARANTAEMTRFLGGIESHDELAARHEQYLAFADSGEGAMFRIEIDGIPAGYAGWWLEQHDGAPAYEIGCAVEPAWQGRGVATEALTRVVMAAAARRDHPVVGYAGAGNAASNALCRRIGFELRGTGVFPAPEGDMPVNIWIFEAMR